VTAGQSPKPGRLRGISVGVSNEALQRIGLVMVLAAQLDHRRMTLRERAAGVPVEVSAAFDSKKIKNRLKDAYERTPLDRVKGSLDDWLAEVDDLLVVRHRYAHSVTYYQVDGLANSGSYRLHPRTGEVSPVVNEPELDDEIHRFAAAGSVGSTLDIETGILLEGGTEAYERHLAAHREFEASSARLMADDDDIG
jgi:hypothetical protein